MWVLSGHIRNQGLLPVFGTLPDEERQVSKCAEFHYQVYVGRRLGSSKKGYDMWVLELLQYVDFEVEVLHELLVELGLVDRLYSNECRSALDSCQNLFDRSHITQTEGRMSTNNE